MRRDDGLALLVLESHAGDLAQTNRDTRLGSVTVVVVAGSRFRGLTFALLRTASGARLALADDQILDISDLLQSRQALHLVGAVVLFDDAPGHVLVGAFDSLNDLIGGQIEGLEEIRVELDADLLLAVTFDLRRRDPFECLELRLYHRVDHPEQRVEVAGTARGHRDARYR